MRFLLLTLLLPVLLTWVSTPTESQVQRTLLVRIDSVKQEELLKTGIVTLDEYNPRSLITLVRDTALALLTKTETDLLRERGFRTNVIMEDSSELQLMQRAYYGPTMRLEQPYHTYDAIVREIDALAKLRPSQIRVYPSGVTTRNRQIVEMSTFVRD
jgi:hypothetical protein